MSLEGSCILSQLNIVDYGKKKRKKKDVSKETSWVSQKLYFQPKDTGIQFMVSLFKKNQKHKKTHDDISWPPRNVSEFSSSLLAETVSPPCQLHTVWTHHESLLDFLLASATLLSFRRLTSIQDTALDLFEIP